MDKPAALIITPKDKKSKKYELKDKDNNKYVLIITVNDDKLFLDLNEIKVIPKQYFKYDLTLEELQKLSWVFYRYSDIYTLFDKTFLNMKENQIEIVNNDKNISVIRKIIQDDEVIKIQFDLEEKILNSENKYDSLISIISEQNKIINELKQSIEKQNKEIETLKTSVNILFKMNYNKINLKLVNRDYTCDICRNQFTKNSYCCESLDFDICENCFNQIKI